RRDEGARAAALPPRDLPRAPAGARRRPRARVPNEPVSGRRRLHRRDLQRRLREGHAAGGVDALKMPLQPPRNLQDVRDPLKAGVEAEYDRIESEIAKECARLRCPHPYLGLESLTGPKEAWWFNGYDSAADQEQV